MPLDWLIARPIAHRGLHDATRNIIENTASAVSAAVTAGYGVEVDLQITADDEAVVYHDDSLGRLTEGKAALCSMTAAALKTVPFRATADRMITLGELFDLVGGRSTLVLELKSRFDGDRRLARRVAALMAGYRGPAAAMSFDPIMVEALRLIDRGVVRGMVAERRYDHPAWASLPVATKRNLAYFLHGNATRPHFVAYAVRDLPAAVPWLARRIFGLPLLTWTVRSHNDRQRAAQWADQMIFEGFRP